MIDVFAAVIALLLPFPFSSAGQGQFGTVEKVRHTPSGLVFAVKKIRCVLDSAERKRTLREKDVAMRSTSCPYAITFYGALFFEGDVLICMEVMHINLKDLYTRVYELNEYIPEHVMRVIIFSIVSALRFLHRSLHIMHRDVKPSNVLVNRAGNVKVCDFGISGELIDSMVYTQQIGSSLYLAPERVLPPEPGRGYTILSDVWSLGITVLELATGRFPFRPWHTIFNQLNDLVHSPPPQLPSECVYSPELRQFLESCLRKNVDNRLQYEQLLQMPLLLDVEENMDIADYVCRFIRDDEG